MRSIPLVVAALVLCLLLVSMSPVAGDGPQGATVFPVVPPGDDGATAGQIEALGAVAGAPSRARALVAGTGRVDALLYRNRTFGSYGFDTRHIYTDAAWAPGGGPSLVGISPRERRSLLWRFNRSGLQRIVATNATLRSVDVDPRGRWLVAGSGRSRGSGFMGVVTPGGETRRIRVPDGTPILDVAWRPGGGGAVAVGARGGLFHYRGGAVRALEVPSDAVLSGVAWRRDGDAFAAVGAVADDAENGSNGGVVVLGDRDGVRRVATVDAPVADVAWRPEASSAIAVGGNSTAPVVHTIDGEGLQGTRGLPSLVGDVAWYDHDNALLIGNDSVWRWSHDTEPGDLPATASLTVSPSDPRTGQSVRISGYGSTSNGSIGRIGAWQFVVGRNVTGWIDRPNVSLRPKAPGRARVGVRVRTTDGTVSPWSNRTLTVRPSDPTAGSDRPSLVDTDRDLAGMAILAALTAAVLVALLAASAIRRRRSG